MRNRFLTLFASLGLVFAVAVSVHAQSDPAAKLEALSKQLQLTPQQKMKMLPLLKEEGPKIEAIKNNSSLSGIQKMKELRAIHSETAPQMQQILSPAQYEKLQTIRRSEIEQAMQKKRGGG